MRLIRRVMATLAMAGIAAIGVRLGGKGGTPRQHGGWKPVDLDGLDPRTNGGPGDGHHLHADATHNQRESAGATDTRVDVTGATAVPADALVRG